MTADWRLPIADCGLSIADCGIADWAARRATGAPPERSGAFGAPASDGDGGSGGAKPPGLNQTSEKRVRIQTTRSTGTAAMSTTRPMHTITNQ